MSTSGATIEQRVHILSNGMQAVAQEGGVTQRRTANGFLARTNQGGGELVDLEAGSAEAARIAEQALELLSAAECPSERADLVLAPDQMMLQIHESVGPPPGAGQDPRRREELRGGQLREALGHRHAALRLPAHEHHLRPDHRRRRPPPTAPTTSATPRARSTSIRDGILVRALGSLESQARAGKPGVANQRAQDWFRPPIDRMANLNLEPGADSFDGDHRLDREGRVHGDEPLLVDRRPPEQVPVRLRVRHGSSRTARSAPTVRNPNYRGISASFWRNLFKVGDASTFAVFGTPNCGKGEPNQVITTGHASPVCAFRGVEIFGGES